MSEEGTITRERRFAQIPDTLITDTRVSPLAVRVWARLDRYAGKDGRAFPSRETLAKDLGQGVRTIARALSELVDTGWITREVRKGKPTLTRLNERSTRASGGTPPVPSEARTRASGGTPPVPSEAHRRRASEGEPLKDSVRDADAAPGSELDLGLPPASGADPVQILVGAYTDAWTESGGVCTKAARGACGRNVKRLIDQDHIELPVILQAVRRAGAARSKDLDRHLGEAQQAYGRPATRRAMFAAWDQIAANLTAKGA